MKKILILLVVGLFFLTSCGTGTRLGGINERSVHQGTEGLEMEFLEGVPLKKVTENSEFKMDIRLMNEGTSDVVNGVLVLGLEESLMQSRFGNKEQINLEGKSNERPVADSEVKEFLIETKEIKGQTESMPTNLFVTACYDYTTKASFNVCIDTNPNSQEEKACEVKIISSPGQGAPVAVTRVEPKMLGFDSVKPQFTLSIENLGDGEVIRVNRAESACSSEELVPDDINLVYVDAFLSEVPLNCEPNPIKLKGKEDLVRCVMEEGVIRNEPTFSTVLTVLLDYGYTSSISKEIIIENVDY